MNAEPAYRQTIVWVHGWEPLKEAVARMRTYDVGSVAVTESDDLIGILSERDIVRAIDDGVDLETIPVSHRMTRQPSRFPRPTETQAAALQILDSACGIFR